MSQWLVHEEETCSVIIIVENPPKKSAKPAKNSRMEVVWAVGTGGRQFTVSVAHFRRECHNDSHIHVRSASHFHLR